MSSLGLVDRYGNPLFQKSYLSNAEQPGTYVGGPDTYGDYEARRFRYALFWALYENNAYDAKLHSWASQRNQASGLYRHIRGAYCPAYRLAEAYANHLYTGRIDEEAGDGTERPSAIPIKTRTESIRRPIARLWRDSNWAVNKAIYGRIGTVTGDAPLVLYDDPINRRITMEVVDPACLRWVGFDRRGNVRGYIRQERRPNPDYNPARTLSSGDPMDAIYRREEEQYALYTEACWRDGDTIIYETYKGEGQRMTPYDWRGVDSDQSFPTQWTVEYGFVPMAINRHILTKPGQAWGQGEYNSLLCKTDEVNDLGSKLHDQIRKCVEGMWFFSGVQAPTAKQTVARGEVTTADNQPARQEQPVIYAAAGATAIPLVIPIDIQMTSIEIMNQIKDLEADSPLLRYDRARQGVSGDASAKALRELRKPAEGVVQERRVGYDDTLVRAQKMALTMGSLGRYDEYKDIPRGAYESGLLDHAVGYRTVFEVDPLDQAELETAQATSISIWVGAKLPLRLALERSGWTDEELAAYDKAKEEEDAATIEMAGQQAEVEALAAPEPTNPLTGPVTSPAIPA